MGAARSAFRRTVRTPVETRGQLEKVLDSEPKLAPKHESTKKLLELARQGNQAKFDADNRRNDEYLSLLKGVHVDTVDVKEKEKRKDSSIEVPSAANNQTGKLSSEQLTFLFQQRMAKPEEWNEEKIQTHFQLSSTSVKNLLKYYSDFNVETASQIPEPLADITG